MQNPSSLSVEDQSIFKMKKSNESRPEAPSANPRRRQLLIQQRCTMVVSAGVLPWFHAVQQEHFLQTLMNQPGLLDASGVEA